jgi:predicted GIY-YIG superfamily endonuclease
MDYHAGWRRYGDNTIIHSHVLINVHLLHIHHEGLDIIMVYCIHLMTPIGHARHYTGSCKNLEKRMREHRKGNTTPLMREVRDRGISWIVSVLDKKGGKREERRYKNRGGASKYCPFCKKAF